VFSLENWRTFTGSFRGENTSIYKHSWKMVYVTWPEVLYFRLQFSSWTSQCCDLQGFVECL